MPFVRRVDVVLASRVVEFARARLDEDVIVRELAVVDRRLVDLQVDRRLRRQVLDEQHRQAFRRHLVHRTERDAVAVREGEPLVDPVAVGQAVGVQLARRQHDLPVLPVDPVAVVVDRHEVVVGPDLLDLREGLQQRLVVPEPDVAERLGVRVDVGAGQRRVARHLALLDAVEREGLARGGDVVLDVRRLARLLVRRDDEALHQRRRPPTRRSPRRYTGAPRRRSATAAPAPSGTAPGPRRPAPPPSARAAPESCTASSTFATPWTMPAGRIEQLGDVEIRAEREQQEGARGERGEVAARRPADARAAVPVERARQRVDGARGERRHEHQRQQEARAASSRNPRRKT